MRLLIIGVLDGHIGQASRIAKNRGATVLQADHIDAGLDIVRSGRGADLVLIDVVLDVASLIGRLRAERIAVPVVACGIGSDTQAAVAAIKAGAKEYLPLPPDAELIAAVLAAAATEDHAIIHRDPRMAAVLAFADRVAASDASVLITGASGTGKELMARYLHAKSRRAERRFVAVNCAAIPENLLESELFGHEKGAFTGAVARRIGRFEEAGGGTLLLDEISEMDPRLQAKLLRAIQEREIDRVGGVQPVKVDVRILATSNRDLEVAVAEGAFRADLYFRLNVVTLAIPPLAERPADIEVLARHFVAKYARANGMAPPELSPEASRRLAAHGWPGNVRELENAIHRAVLLADDGRIDADAVVVGNRSPAAAETSFGRTPDMGTGMGLAEGSPHALVGQTVADVERTLIIDTLEHCLGNRTHAANILGISIRTLRNKLRQYSAEGFAVPVAGGGDRTSIQAR
ncbi:MAG: sigma-54-dependent Fis family transcriptional regulator [Rhodospirillales bacterium]|nr:MAG: sigma-54-dependent Fis family transcriptional regulator [Rhodospirillales bacterium]